MVDYGHIKTVVWMSWSFYHVFPFRAGMVVVRFAIFFRFSICCQNKSVLSDFTLGMRVHLTLDPNADRNPFTVSLDRVD